MRNARSIDARTDAVGAPGAPGTPAVDGEEAGRSETFPLRPIKLSDQLYDQILLLIRKGEFPENSKLPSENALAERFCVSRPVVREALARLRDDNIIASRQGAGSYVKHGAGDLVQVFEPLASIEDVQAIYEYRAAIEGEAAALAAARRTPADLETIARTLRSIDRATAEGRLGAGEGLSFHVAISKASRNRYLAVSLDLMLKQVSFVMALARNLSVLPPVERARQHRAEHLRIFDAIEAGEPERARTEMRAHIENACRRIFHG